MSDLPNPPVFSRFPIDGQVFFASPLSLGVVNLMPVVPGHVLVISRRVEPRFGGLSKEEVTDLWLSVHRIAGVIEKAFNASSLTIAIQDGPLAGQTVPHVHVHILPRHLNDFEPMDKVYEELAAKAQELRAAQEVQNGADEEQVHKDLMTKVQLARAQNGGELEARPLVLDPKSLGKPRSKEEMVEEAKWLEKFFEENERFKN